MDLPGNDRQQRNLPAWDAAPVVDGKLMGRSRNCMRVKVMGVYSGCRLAYLVPEGEEQLTAT